MQRYDFFFRQKVTEGELDAAFDAVEQMEFNSHLAGGIVGIQSQAIVTENSGTPNLTVDVSGPAEIRDQLGQRINWTPAQDVDCSVDESSNSTAVTTPGNERWLSVFAKFERTLSDPRLDGTGATVQFNRAEGFTINVVQGAEAPISTAVRPALRADEVLLADVRLINGQTQILNSDIDTTRREDAFVITDGASNVFRAGTSEGAIQEVVTALGADITGVVHLAGAETITGSKTFEALLRLGAAGAFIDATALSAAGIPDPIIRDVVRRPTGDLFTATLTLTKIAEFISDEDDGGALTARTRLFTTPQGGVMITYNCDYNNTTQLWSADAAHYASAVMVGTGSNGAAPGIAWNSRIRRVAAAGETWNDTPTAGTGGWNHDPGIQLLTAIGDDVSFFSGSVGIFDRGKLLFNDGTGNNFGTNPAFTDAPGSNSLYGKNIPKVWGKIEINAGSVLLAGRDAFGIASVVAAAPLFTVNYATTFQNTQYAINAAPYFDVTGTRVLMFAPTSIAAGSTTFEIRRCDTGANVSIAGVFAFCNLLCFGEHF